MTDLSGKVLLASFMHAPVISKVDICRDALITIASNGTIVSVIRPDESAWERKKSAAREEGRLVELPRQAFLLPGFIDLHIHAPQWPQLGKALDVPLEVWLQQYTFPLEARYSDAAFARKVYADLVISLLAHGTTTALYLSTIHAEATRLLTEICLEKGQRALVGKVVMDEPDQCPDYYRDASAEIALEETQSFIEFVRSMPGNAESLVLPVVTPRFIPSCTDLALTGLGKIASEYACHVQTHCSESDWEHGYVIERTGQPDTEALRDFGLLGRHTVLAHSNFITDSDMDTIAAAGAGIAHCPLSNVYFSNAVFPLRRALEKSLHVGLGTDISGGPSASMFDTCRQAISASRMLEDGVDATADSSDRGVARSRINFREAFHLATAGGATVLDLQVGRFEDGYAFDAILIDPEAVSAPIRINDEFDTLDDQLQKIVNNATRANIATVWVSGIKVAGSST
jgi:guanine deaminase